MGLPSSLSSLQTLQRPTLPRRNVDLQTHELLVLILTIVPSLLVEDGVDGDGGLSSLSISNDQLSLSSTDGNHGVDGLETGLHGLEDGSSGKNSRGLEGGSSSLNGVDRSLSVDGVSQSVEDSSKESRSDGNVWKEAENAKLDGREDEE